MLAKTKKRKPSVKTLRRKAWDLLSKCIRQEAANSDGMVGCYTCQRVAHWTEMDAGHAIGGRGNGVLFDERLIKVQCRYDNRMRAGAYEVFIPKLMREHLWTLEDWEQIVIDSRGAHKISAGEYEEMIAGYRRRLKQLEDAA